MSLTVLSGDDTFSIRKAVAHVISSGGFAPLDVERVDAASTRAQAVLMTVGTPGLFAASRLILVDGLGQEKRSGGRSKKKDATEDSALTLEQILAATPEQTCVVANLSGLRSDSVLLKEAVKLAKEKRLIHRAFPAPKPREMAGWLTEQSRRAGLKLEPQAARQLALRAGDQLAIAGAELEKLGVASGPDGTITSSMVEALVAKTAEEAIFPLVDAIALGQRDRAFQLLARQLDQIHGTESEVSLPLIRLVARQMRLLLRIKLLTVEGKSRSDIISQLKIPEYFADRYFTQAARINKPRIVASLESLVATEHGIKNGEAGPAALQLLVADLTAA